MERTKLSISKRFKWKQIISRSILAGIMIGIAGTVNLSIDNSYLGAFLFSLGLITIVLHTLYLFTGRIGTVSVKAEWSALLVIIFGNYIGTLIVAELIRFTRFSSNLIEKATNIYNIKMNDSLLSIFILAIFCGILMYIAVTSEYQNNTVMVIILPIMVFILAGFEHSIANMFYFNLAWKWSTEAILKIIVMLIGNGIGSIGFRVLKERFNT